MTRTAWALDAGNADAPRPRSTCPNPDDGLRPGLYAYATIIAEEHKDALTVPTTAIVKDGGKSFCVAVAGGQAKRKEIKLGLSRRQADRGPLGPGRGREGGRGERRLARRGPGRRGERAPGERAEAEELTQAAIPHPVPSRLDGPDQAAESA